MATIAEFREFFFRSVKVLAGLKPDQQTNYPTSYTVNTPTGLKSVGNRLLKDHYPSEDVLRKLAQSLTFKLNVEDTSTPTTQGLVKLATDAQAKANTASFSDGFARAVKPSQLPTVGTLESSSKVFNTIISSFSASPGALLVNLIDPSIGTRNETDIYISDVLMDWLYDTLLKLRNYTNAAEYNFDPYPSIDSIPGIYVALVSDTAGTASTPRNILKGLVIINETPKVIDTVGSMGNGSAIPSKGANYVDATDASLDMDFMGRVTLTGSYNILMNDAVGDNKDSIILFTLPAGYRKSFKEIPVVITDRDFSGNLEVPSTVFTNGNNVELRIPIDGYGTPYWSGQDTARIAFHLTFYPTS